MKIAFKLVSALLMINVGIASAGESCGVDESASLLVNPYSKDVDGNYHILKLGEDELKCILKNSSLHINPYLESADGTTLIDRFFEYKMYTSISNYKDVLSSKDLTKYNDYISLRKLKTKSPDEFYDGLVHQLMLLRLYESARLVLDTSPSLGLGVDEDGYTVPQSLVMSLNGDDLSAIKMFNDLDFNLYSESVGVTPMQMLCKKDYIKSFSYLIYSGNSPFQENLYGSDTIDLMGDEFSPNCSTLIKKILYEVKDK